LPLLPASLTEPLWVQFSTLFNEDDRPEFVADHPWGCHRRPIPNRVVFNHVLAALVHGNGYKRIATPGCSDRTIRRRPLDWAERDVGVEQLKAARRLRPDDRPRPRRPLIGWVDHQIPLRRGTFGSIPGRSRQARHQTLGGHRRARHPPRPGRRRRQPARLTAVRTPMRQIPNMIGPLPDQPWVHPDRGYDSTPTRDLLDELGYVHEIARKPIPAPIQAGKRWAVEHTHSLDERLRQNPPLHRETQQHHRVLPAPRRHPHRNPPPHQRRPHPLPLAGPTHHPPTQPTINCRTF